MAENRQSEVTIGVPSTADRQGPGTDLSSTQDPIDGSSSHGASTEDVAWLYWGLRKYLILLGVLAVGVTYNAGLTPPGGFWTLNKDGHHAGDPIMRDGFPERYEVFFYCNATAFAASLVLIILLLSKSVTKKVIWLRSMQLTMIIGLFSLLGAYAAGSCRAVKSSIYIWILVFAVFFYIGIHILVSTKVIPEALTKKLRTILHGMLTRCGLRDRLVIIHIKKDVEEVRKFILMLVTFAATITYQAGLNPPGGFWAENEHGSSIHLALPPYKHHPATSVLGSNYHHRYNVFVSSNSTSFVASLVIIILLLSPELSGHGIRTNAVFVCVVADLVCLIVAYAAGCCRELATSFYVVFIIIIVSVSFALLAAIFGYRPVANFLAKVRTSSLWCMVQLGRALSLNNKSRNAEQGNSLISYHQSSVRLTDASAEDNTPEPQDQPADNQQSLNIEEGEPHEEHAPAGNQQISDIQEVVFSSQHPSGNCQHSENTEHEKVKSRSLRFMAKLGRALSLNSKSRNAEQGNSSAEDNTAVPRDQPADNQQSLNIEEGEPHEEHGPADNQKNSDIQKAVTNSQHPSGNCQHSENTEHDVLNLECQSTDEPLCANVKEEDVSSSQHPSRNCQHSENTEHDVPTNCKQVANVEVDIPSTEQEYPSSEPQDEPTNNQQAANMRQQSPTDDPKITVLPVEKNMSVSHSSNGDTSRDIVEEGISASTEAGGNVGTTEQGISVEDDNRQTEIGSSDTHLAHSENGHSDGSQGVPTQNADDIRTEKHLKKTRTYLLLLAILAASLAYQSGLNPPGGFWSRSEDHHSAADRILEDNYHRRFIAFFYLNAVAFVASIIIIMMLLNKMMSNMATKRRVLPIMMIVVLLSLTGAFAMGSCREAKKPIRILVLVCIVLAYVLLHVLIAVHIIPCWAVPSQSGHDNPGDDTSEKELDRRRSLLLTLAILAVTVTYQAGMNPPGGVWSDDKDVTGTPGNPILQDTHPKRYDVFYYSNSVSFVSSVVVTILLVNKESCEHGIRSYALRVCLVVGLLGLLVAYVAGSCRNTKQAIFLSIIAMGVLVSLMIQVVLSSTLGKPLVEYIGGFLECLLPREDAGQATVTSETPEVSDDEKIVRKRHKYLMFLATLAASIAYQAGLSPPGGFWSGDEDHVAGNPVLHDINHLRYKIFFCFNSFAFMASIVMIMLLLSKSVRKKDVPLKVLHLIMILDLLALMTAFAAGSCRHLRTSLYIFALAVASVGYLVLLIVSLSAVAKYLKSRGRSGVFSWRRLEPASRTNTAAVPEPGLQV